MDNHKNDSYYIQKAIKDISAILKYSKGKLYEDFVEDEQLIDSVMFRFIQLAENIKNISNEFKEQNKQVPWGKIIGFRNGIVHEYGETDYSIVYDIIFDNLEDLKKLFEHNIK